MPRLSWTPAFAGVTDGAYLLVILLQALDEVASGALPCHAAGQLHDCAKI